MDRLANAQATLPGGSVVPVHFKLSPVVVGLDGADVAATEPTARGLAADLAGVRSETRLAIMSDQLGLAATTYIVRRPIHQTQLGLVQLLLRKG